MKSAAIVVGVLVTLFVAVGVAGAVFVTTLVDTADPSEYRAVVTSCGIGPQSGGKHGIVAEVDLTNLTEETHRYTIIMDVLTNDRQSTSAVGLGTETDDGGESLAEIAPGETRTIRVVAEGARAPSSCEISEVLTF